MSVATVMTILGIVNALLSIAKDAPSVIAEAKSLLVRIEPHVEAAGEEAKRAFAAAKERLS